MKTKRFLSLLLALVMSLALAAPAFAADADTGDVEPVMPRLQIFPDDPVTGYGRYRSSNFSATPGNGKTIHVWFQNGTDHQIEIRLFRVGTANPVLTGIAQPHSNWPQGSEGDYTSPTADSGTYYVELILRGNYLISGRLAVAQYP